MALGELKVAFVSIFTSQWPEIVKVMAEMIQL